MKVGDALLPARARASFGPDRRIRRHDEFVRAQQMGRRVTTAHFTLLVAAQPVCEGEPRRARLGLVTSRKIGGAVQRNRVRRLCRECFRRWPDLVPAGIDLVVIARPGADRLGLAEVDAEWRGVARLLQKRAADALAQGDVRPHVGAGKPC